MKDKKQQLFASSEKFQKCQLYDFEHSPVDFLEVRSQK